MNGYYTGYPFNPNVVSLARSVPTAATSTLGRSIAPALASSAARPGILSSIGAATKGFTFTGFLNGASKTLGVINQAIPIFYQVKPIWNNAKTMLRVMKEVGSNDSTEVIREKVKEANSNSNNEVKSTSNNPTFFA